MATPQEKFWADAIQTWIDKIVDNVPTSPPSEFAAFTLALFRDYGKCESLFYPMLQKILNNSKMRSILDANVEKNLTPQSFAKVLQKAWENQVEKN